MKRLSMLVLFAAITMASTVTKSMAENFDIYAGGNVGVLVPNQSNINSSLAGGAEAGFSNDFWGADLSLLYCSAQAKTASGVTEGLPKVGMVPISLTPFLQYKVEKAPGIHLPLTLKIGAGITYGLISYDNTKNLETSTEKIFFRQTIDNGFGYNFKGGLDVKLNEHFSVGADLIYLILKPQSTTYEKDESNNGFSKSYSESTSKGNIDLSSIIFTAAVKYHF